MSCRIQAIRHRCAAGLANAHPSLQDRILLNQIRIENVHKVRKKNFHFFVMYKSPANLEYSFLPAETLSLA